MNLKRTAQAVLGKEINEEFRTCKLIGVETRYGVTNNTPILALVYQFEDTGEVVNDNYYFTEKSLETVIKRLNSAYLGFTGEQLNVEDFSSPKILIDKFNSIIGAESQVKEYINKNSYYCYQHKISQQEEVVNAEEQNMFWSELKEETEVKENNNNEVNNSKLLVPNNNSVDSANLQDLLEDK